MSDLNRSGTGHAASQSALRRCFGRFAPLLCLLAGCDSGQPVSTRQLNEGLTHIPWGKVNEAAVPLQPGMRLRFTMTSLAPQGQNVQPPLLSRVDWTIPPPDAWTEADKQILVALLQQSEPVDGGATRRRGAMDLAAMIRARGEAVRRTACDPPMPACVASFNRMLGEAVYAPIAASMRVVYGLGVAAEVPGGAQPEGERGSAEWARTVFCRVLPSDHRLTDPATPPRRRLVFDTWTGEGEERLRVQTFHWNTALGIEPIGNAAVLPGPNPPRNATATAEGAREGRGWVQPLIPFRIAGETRPRFAPLCTTVEEVERIIGQSVAAIRRDLRFLPATASQPADTSGWGAKPFAAGDTAFPIALTRGEEPGGRRVALRSDQSVEWPSDDPVALLAPQGDRDTILLAPGDLLLLGNPARPSGPRQALADPMRFRDLD